MEAVGLKDYKNNATCCHSIKKSRRSLVGSVLAY